MAERWVLPWLFNARAATVDWEFERERRNYEGRVFESGAEAGRVQVRWLLHPALGLPLAPFTVWRLPSVGTLTDQELANLDDWEPVELVGLPVDASWAGVGYPPDDQGPLGAPLTPPEAALRRLEVGAPRIGWSTLQANGEALPPWEPSDPQKYRQELVDGRLLGGLKRMLGERPDPLTHASFMDWAEEDAGLGLHPGLLGGAGDRVGVPDRPARTGWHPLGLLAVGAGSDPLASLGLGFGTALDAVDGESPAVMVSVPHRLSLGGQEFPFELAAVARLADQPRPPDPPTGLAAAALLRNRPEVTDGPGSETVGVDWDRPANPHFSLQSPDAPYPASYAVGAFGPAIRRSAILLTRRSEAVRGWLPFVAGRPEEARPVRFADQLSRTTTIGGQVVPDIHPGGSTYAVAAQDLFGRWGEWQTVAYHADPERPQTPAIIAVRIDHDGALEVDCAWDWTDRSPEFIELSGAFEDEPGTVLFSARLQFGGEPEPTAAGAEARPLDATRAPIADWGVAQDRPDEAPGVRFYRLTAAVPFAFGGRRSRVIAVRARGQCHLHEAFMPGFNVSPFGPPVRSAVDDPAPPPPPTVPEVPQWASLPDAAGVSRAVLSWPGDPNVAGYALYEATETALLSAFGQPGTDTAAPFTDRLAVLRGLDLPSKRAVFRRVREKLIPPATPTTSFEVALPRGSGVIHLYAVTAMSHNQVESAWPATSKQFIAVATPRLAVPAAPALEATADPAAGPPRVRLRLWPGQGPALSRIDIYRTTKEALGEAALAADTDAMGPPVGSVAANGTELTFDDDAAPVGWRRLWYRAVAWADDEPAGQVGARSPASAAVSVLLPPQTPPTVVDLQGNLPGSTDAECLVGWGSDAPVAPTPLGPHSAVVENTDATGNPLVRLEGRLDALPTVADLANLPAADPNNRTIFRVGTADETTQFAAWMPRPAPDQPFRMVVKMVDPLNRIGRAEAEVPP